MGARSADVEDDVVEGVPDLHDEPAVIDQCGDVDDDRTVYEVEDGVAVDGEVVGVTTNRSTADLSRSNLRKLLRPMPFTSRVRGKASTRWVSG